MQHASDVSAVNASSATRALLAGGVVAGPVYVVVGLVEAFTREGFDLAHHSLSLLANGPLGWIHGAMLVVTGLLAIAGATGLRQALADGPGRGWGPVLVGVYGAALVAAGFLTADPAQGFPPGTAEGPPATYTWHGIGHLAAGGIGFLCLIAACAVFARRFARQGERGWAAYSLATGGRLPRRLCRHRVGKPGRLGQAGVRRCGGGRLDLDLGALCPGPARLPAMNEASRPPRLVMWVRGLRCPRSP
jgi:Protein of unknown function (DUF998)